MKPDNTPDPRILGCDGIVTGCSGAIAGAIFAFVLVAGLLRSTRDAGPLTLLLFLFIVLIAGACIGGLLGKFLGAIIARIVHNWRDRH